GHQADLIEASGTVFHNVSFSEIAGHSAGPTTIVRPTPIPCGRRLLPIRAVLASKARAALCELPHIRKPGIDGSIVGSATDRGEAGHANAPNLLLPGALRGAEFHAGGQTVRRLPTLADERHYCAGAGAGWCAFPTQAADHAHSARPRRTSLVSTHRRERGSC